MIFRTHYTLPSGRRTSTQVHARDRAHLDEVMALRGMGETSEGEVSSFVPEMPSDRLKAGDYEGAMHALIWVSMIAGRTNTTAWMLLNDEGIIHELAHRAQVRRSALGFLSYAGDYGVSALVERIREFEQAVPGVHRRWGMTEKAWAAEEAEQLDALRCRQEVMQRALASLSRAAAKHLGREKGDTVYLLGDPDATAAEAVIPRRRARPGTRDFHLDQLAQQKQAKADQLAKLGKARSKPVAGTTVTETSIVEHAARSVTGRTSHKAPHPLFQSLPRRGDKTVVGFDIETGGVGDEMVMVVARRGDERVVLSDIHTLDRLTSEALGADIRRTKSDTAVAASEKAFAAALFGEAPEPPTISYRAATGPSRLPAFNHSIA